MCIRDRAKGHVAALKKLDTKCGLFVCNLGTGKGYSVLDILHAYETVSYTHLDVYKRQDS